MKKENLNEQKIDKFLKKALKDDLPPEIERNMKRQLILFREKMEGKRPQSETEAVSFLWRLLSGQRVEWGQFMLKRGVMALASIIIVVLGIRMQTTGSQGGLAESLTALGTSASVFDQLHHVESMECQVILYDKNKETLQYSIHWLPPNQTRIHLEKSGEIPVKTMWFKEQEIIIVDHAKKTTHKVKNIEQIKEPQFQKVMSFFSPFVLGERLQEQWVLKQFRQQEDCEWGIFTVAIPEEKILLELTVDLCTFLPTNFKKFLADPKKESGKGKILMNVNFKWNTPIPPQLMFPKITKGSSCG